MEICQFEEEKEKVTRAENSESKNTYISKMQHMSLKAHKRKSWFHAYLPSF